MSKANKTTSKTTTTTTSAQDLQNAIIEAFKIRIDNAENDNQRDYLTKEKRFFEDKNAEIIIEKSMQYIDFARFANQIKITEKKNRDYLAQYIINKIRRFAYGIANNTKSFIDGYSNSILFNLSELQNMTMKSRLVSLSKSAVYLETEKIQEIKRKINVSLNTADTQASSSKQAFIFLNITNGQKGKRDDDIEFKDNDTANFVKAWFVQ